MLLEKLVAAGIGNRPVVFVTHRFSIVHKNYILDIYYFDRNSCSYGSSYMFFSIMTFAFLQHGGSGCQADVA